MGLNNASASDQKCDWRKQICARGNLVKNCVGNMEYFQMFGAPEIVSRLFFEVFICMTPILLLLVVLCTMKIASCVWSRCSGNQEAEDLEMNTCNNVYINSR